MFDLAAMKQSIHKKIGTCNCSSWNNNSIKVAHLNWFDSFSTDSLWTFWAKNLLHNIVGMPITFKKKLCFDLEIEIEFVTSAPFLSSPPPLLVPASYFITVSNTKKKFPFLHKLFITSLIQSGWLTSVQILTTILADGQHFRLYQLWYNRNKKFKLASLAANYVQQSLQAFTLTNTNTWVIRLIYLKVSYYKYVQPLWTCLWRHSILLRYCRVKNVLEENSSWSSNERYIQ